jgi:hypothetical protein
LSEGFCGEGEAIFSKETRTSNRGLLHAYARSFAGVRNDGFLYSSLRALSEGFFLVRAKQSPLVKLRLRKRGLLHAYARSTAGVRNDGVFRNDGFLYSSLRVPSEGFLWGGRSNLQ